MRDNIIYTMPPTVAVDLLNKSEARWFPKKVYSPSQIEDAKDQLKEVKGNSCWAEMRRKGLIEIINSEQ